MAEKDTALWKETFPNCKRNRPQYVLILNVSLNIIYFHIRHLHETFMTEELQGFFLIGLTGLQGITIYIPTLLSNPLGPYSQRVNGSESALSVSKTYNNSKVS